MKNGCFLVVWALSACLSLVAQDSDLRYRLAPGEHYVLEVEMNQQSHAESYIREEVNLTSQLVLHFRVDSVPEPDRICMQSWYEEVRLSMLAPGLGIDLSSEDQNETALHMLANALEGKTFQLCMKKDGSLLGMEGLADHFRQLSRLPYPDTTELAVAFRTLEESYGPDSYTSLFGLFVSLYPSLGFQTHWTRDMTYHFNSKAVLLNNSYQLSSVSEERWISQGIGLFNAHNAFREITSIGEVEAVITGSQTYDFLMDPATGWLQKCNARQRTLVETTVIKGKGLPTGLKIPSYTETLFEVRGKKLEHETK
ncbi:MAG: DUF6263 family protein [Bacteroidales bacterium]